MSQVLELVETGTTLLQYTCVDAETKQALDLSDATYVKLTYSLNGAAAATVNTTVTDAANGLVEYRFASTLLEEGSIVLQLSILYAGSIQHFQTNPHEISVRRKVQ